MTDAARLHAPPSPSDGLAADTAALAARMADVFARAGGEGALAAEEAFLRTMAAARGDTGPGDPARDRAAGDNGRAPDPLDRLAGALDLSPVERDLLVLAGLGEEHEGYAGVLRRVHPRGEPLPTAGLAAQLLCETPTERPTLRRVLETGAAVREGVVELRADGPFFERSLAMAEGLWSVLHGVDVWPAALTRLDAPAVGAGLETWLDESLTRRAVSALVHGMPVTVLLGADSVDVALHRALALAARAGVPVVALSMPAATPELEHLVSVHALARGVVPVLRLEAADQPGVARFPGFAGHPAPIVVCAAQAGFSTANGPRPMVPVPISPLSRDARSRMWSAALPELAEESALLATRHVLEPAAAAQAAADVRAIEALDRRTASVDDVARTVRARAGLSLSAGIKMLHPTATWESLVLPPDATAQVREAVARLRHHGTVLGDWRFLHGRPGASGVRMLFAGPPGTGKTLSAEVIAGALGVDLLLVDISRVVSKWIGETEKNLAEVFEAAERSQAVLFFDEADALFGRRTEVSDAHDRYANLETAYLLMRIERFEGLAVLSTNARQNIDPAFIRRLEFVIDFDEPGPTDREALWRCHIPGEAPLSADVDLAELATAFPVVGGVIRNAAVAAGFLAAEDRDPISRKHLIRAIRREYDKSGRAFPGVPEAVRG